MEKFIEFFFKLLDGFFMCLYIGLYELKLLFNLLYIFFISVLILFLILNIFLFMY